MDCRVLTSEEEIEEISEAWRQLHARAGQSPFTDCYWFEAWWRLVGKTSGLGLHVVVGDEAGRLAGVLPLVVKRQRGLRVLEAAGRKSYYYCDVLCENDAQASILWEAARQSPHYDFADVRDVYPESACHRALAVFARRREVVDAFFLRFRWKSGAEWVTSLAGKVRGNYRRRARQLEQKGKLTWHRYEDGPVPLPVLDGFVKCKVAWCKARGKTGLFDHPAVFEYFHEMVEATAKQRRLFLAWLTCDEAAIAFILGLNYRGVLHLPFWTYSPAWAQYSPVHVAMVRTIEWAIDSGLKGVDFRQGSSIFKRKYANETRSCDEFTFNNGVKGRMLEETFILARNTWNLLKGNRDSEIGDTGPRHLVLDANAGQGRMLRKGRGDHALGSRSDGKPRVPESRDVAARDQKRRLTAVGSGSEPNSGSEPDAA